MESKLTSTLQLLRGIELLYPDIRAIKQVRISLLSLKTNSEPDHDHILKSFFNLLKMITQDPIVDNLEKVCLHKDHVQSVIAIIALTSSDSNQYNLLFNLKYEDDKNYSQNQKVLLSYIDQQSAVHELLKSIILADNVLVKIQKIIQYLRQIIQSEKEDIYDYMRKLYNNIHDENFDLHVWSFLYKLTDIYLIDRLKLINIKYPDSKVHQAFSKGQIESKLWIIKEIYHIPMIKDRDIHILCGWYSVLAYLIFQKVDDKMTIRSYDIDPDCFPISCIINHPQKRVGLFKAWVRDIYTQNFYKKDAVLINTSCEHLSNFNLWFSSIPEGQFVVLQSNDFFDCSEHVNCMHSLEDFKNSAPLTQVMYSGELKLEKYTRYMLIGMK